MGCPVVPWYLVVAGYLVSTRCLWSLSCSLLDLGSILASKYLEGLVSKLKSGRGLFYTMGAVSFLGAIYVAFLAFLLAIMF